MAPIRRKVPLVQSLPFPPISHQWRRRLTLLLQWYYNYPPLSSALPSLPISSRILYERLSAPLRPLFIDTRVLATYQSCHLRHNANIAIPSLIDDPQAVSKARGRIAIPIFITMSPGGFCGCVRRRDEPKDKDSKPVPNPCVPPPSLNILAPPHSLTRLNLKSRPSPTGLSGNNPLPLTSDNYLTPYYKPPHTPRVYGADDLREPPQSYFFF